MFYLHNTDLTANCKTYKATALQDGFKMASLGHNAITDTTSNLPMYFTFLARKMTADMAIYCNADCLFR